MVTLKKARSRALSPPCDKPLRLSKTVTLKKARSRALSQVAGFPIFQIDKVTLKKARSRALSPRRVQAHGLTVKGDIKKGPIKGIITSIELFNFFLSFV